ncbi:MAG TPA: cobalamin-dependent protein [Xanthobacteraceae bacterium]|nr:cobalamin-dependent protein [Xanthobacteraceae bacterium]
MSREFVALAIMGIDQHENGAVAVARVLREAQMKVEYLGKFQTPASVADKAIRQGADVVGISCHSWEYMCLVPQLLEELKARGSDIPVVIGGSVITPEDGEKMRQSGVAAVFTNSTDSNAVIECVRALSAARKRPDRPPGKAGCA